MDINGANIVITGASDGIGRGILERLKDYDCNIVAVSRNIEDIFKNDSDNIFYKNFDLRNKEEIDRLFSHAVDKLGSIDIFISNAGFAYYEDIYPADYDHIEEIFRINVTGSFYAAVKMKEINKNRPYNFVSMSSALGHFSFPGYALYCSTKAALKGFADSYRFELGSNQHYQAVYPISTDTHFFIKAGMDSPPKPQQSVEHVSKCVINGIINNKKSIYPSKTFYIVNNFLPFLLKISIHIENRKFRKRKKQY